MKKINLNNLVKVQLRENGKNIYIHQYDDIPGGVENAHLILSNNIDENGFVKMQLWEFIQLFGPYITMGFKLPFDTNIYLKDKDVLNVEVDEI